METTEPPAETKRADAPAAALANASAASIPTLVIEPSRGWVALKVRELWDYRELLFFLAWRDVKVRYKQTFFGVAWAIMQPVATMLIFSLVFGRLARLPSEGVAYPVFALTALLPWTLFASALTTSSNSLVNAQGLIKKVYFPRIIIPVAAVLETAVDFCVAFVVLVGMMAWYGVAPTWNVVFLPLFVAFALTTALAVGFWLSAINVQFRDVRYTIPFVLQFWLFATPVAYSATLVPDRFRALYALNPMVGVVDGFRWALLGRPGPLGAPFFVSVAVVLVLFVGGLAYFRRMERTFADVV